MEKWWRNSYLLFRRQTTSTTFIPEIDGLRFLAIFLVVVTHIQELYLERNQVRLSFSRFWNFAERVFNTGENGVLLFFAISGFILMLPFARYHLTRKNPVSLNKYYLRRLTRLEPPYLIAMTLLFVLKLYVQKKDFSELLPHFGATLLYVHTVIYQELSKITPITWSLEVEIQFYLLAPLLASVYKLPQKPRRTLLGGLIFIAPFLQYFFKLKHFTFLGTFQFFLVGFLLVDFYLCQDKVTMEESLMIPLGVVLAAGLILSQSTEFWGIFFYPYLIFSFYYLVFNSTFWKSIFQNKVLTTIGGMCYSIYLLHFALISFTGTRTFSLKATRLYEPNILLQMALHLPIILFVSSIYYLLIEKPCMDPAWPKKVWGMFVPVTKPRCAEA